MSYTNNESSEEYANRLHKNILTELDQNGVDIYKDRTLYKYNPLIQACKTRVQVYETIRLMSHAPTVVKEKFTSNYWRTWNKDLAILENMSKKDEQKLNKRNIKRKLPPISHKPTNKSLYKSVKSYSFGITNSTPELTIQKDEPKDDSNLSIVHDLILNSLNEKVPDYYPDMHSEIDPDRIGSSSRHVKSGLFSFDEAHKYSINTLTSNCEIVPVDRPKSQKGVGRFLSSPRFK